MARPAARSHANVTHVRDRSRPATGSSVIARTAAAAGISEFRRTCALNGRRVPAEGTLHAARRRPRAARTIPRTARRMRTRRHLQRGFTGTARTAAGRQAASGGQRVTAPAAGGPGAGKPDRRTFLTASYSVLLYVYLPTPVPPGPGECAGSARNKPSRELPDYYTRTARKTIVIGAAGK